MTSRFSPLIAALLAVSWVAPAQATSIAPLTTDQMTDASDLIVRGTVTDVWTTYQNGYARTMADLEIQRTYKGAAAAEHVTIEALGGEFEGLVYEMDGAERYSVGEEIFAFLAQKADRGTYATVAMSLGKYTIKQNPTDGSEMVVRFTVPYGRTYDARFIPNPPKDERISTGTFEAAVRSRVTLGWDGNPIPGVSAEHLRAINHLQPGVR